ncbi:hypothetical protein BKA70DRAFT_1248566 [Coprinopsis sp. MPI-PUGE-AT-0042]|nr:hypothetical protein BKA70DRAFT_1248566 [Coprinopsis sp. MPI-PUGE-AT-0042]
MPASFTPSNAVDMSKEREWPAELGMLDWDNTNIVFTKRTLIEFLKYTGITVDTNFQNISKLPRYAKFGKISGDVDPSEGTESSSGQAITESVSTQSNASDGFKPTRRVRHAPGGPTHDIFATDDDDALSQAPPRAGQQASPVQARQQPQAPQEPEEEEVYGLDFPSAPKPTRRVREQPGGKDHLSNFWDTDDTKDDSFKPTRRVRDAPGGRDNISGLF